MRRPSRRGIAIAAAGGTAAVALALVGPHVAFANDPTPTPSSSASSSTSQSAQPDRDADHAKRQDELATALAKELGIDKDKVAAALAKIESEESKPSQGTQPHSDANRAAELKSRLDAAVKAGTITQSDEDAILKAAQAGVLGGPGGPHPGR